MDKIQKGERINGIEKDPLESADSDLVMEYDMVPGFVRKETSVLGGEKLRMQPHKGVASAVTNVKNKLLARKNKKQEEAAVIHEEEEEKAEKAESVKTDPEEVQEEGAKEPAKVDPPVPEEVPAIEEEEERKVEDVAVVPEQVAE